MKNARKFLSFILGASAVAFAQQAPVVYHPVAQPSGEAVATAPSAAPSAAPEQAPVAPTPVAQAAPEPAPSLDALVASDSTASVSSVEAAPVSESVSADTASFVSWSDAETAWGQDSVPATESAAVDSANVQSVAVAPVIAVDTVSLKKDSAAAAPVVIVQVPVTKIDSSSMEANAPQSPLDRVLHGNAYNPVANEAAAPTVGGEMVIPHRMFSRHFAYFEPVDQEGVVAFGEWMTYFFAFDNNKDLALVTAGLAFSRFGLMVQGAVGKNWSYVDNDDSGAEETVKETDAGTAIGGTLSARLGGLDFAIKGSYEHPEGESAVYGGDVETETDNWSAGGKFLVSHSESSFSWTFGVGVYRYNARNNITEKSVFERGGRYYVETSKARITDSTARVEVTPELNVGGAILTHERARVFLGLNMMVPMIAYDRIKGVCSRHNEYAFVATPNILGEVRLGQYVMAFGSASHQWDVFRYKDTYIDDESTKKLDISSGITTANIGMRLEYEMAALEVAFTKQFLSNPFGSFSHTDEVMTSIGMFINF